MVYHNIVRLDVSVNYSLGMAEVKSFQNFIDIVLNIEISKSTIKLPKILVSSVNILHNKCWSFGGWISDYIKQAYYVNTTSESLQNLDLSSDLSFLNWFEYLDDHSIVILCVDPLVNF